MSYRWKGIPYPDYESLPDEAKGIKASGPIVNVPNSPEDLQVADRIFEQVNAKAPVTPVDPVDPGSVTVQDLGVIPGKVALLVTTDEPPLGDPVEPATPGKKRKSKAAGVTEPEAPDSAE